MYAWVKKYVGISFKSGGRDRDGTDCYGLVRLILNTEYGFDLPLLDSGYTDALDKSQTQALFDANVPLLCGERIEGPEEKAVALIKSRGLPTHVALYAGGGFIIHSIGRLGAVCERISTPGLSQTVQGWYRVSQSKGADKSVQPGDNRI